MNIKYAFGLGIIVLLAACTPHKPGCYERQVCVKRGVKMPCFHCSKLQYYGFAIRPNVIERTTCNVVTRNDLLANKYQCNTVFESQPCLQKKTVTQCDDPSENE